jgi:hypothetical protein
MIILVKAILALFHATVDIFHTFHAFFTFPDSVTSRAPVCVRGGQPAAHFVIASISAVSS